MTAVSPNPPAFPNQHDSQLARVSAQVLAGIDTPEVTLTLEHDDHRIPITLPLSAIKLLQRLLSEMAAGNAVTLMPLRAELTTQQAADLLNVSRPFLTGALPFHRVGTHRRVLVKHLLEYQRESRARSEQAMRELAELSQELGLY
jgi:excisionase family DNA binding protein